MIPSQSGKVGWVGDGNRPVMALHVAVKEAYREKKNPRLTPLALPRLVQIHGDRLSGLGGCPHILIEG